MTGERKGSNLRARAEVTVTIHLSFEEVNKQMKGEMPLSLHRELCVKFKWNT